MNKHNFFDPEWYLKTYPDVAEAGIDPKEHFEKHGKHEGRLPCHLPSLALEKKLWANALNPVCYLSKLEKEGATESINGVYALKVLAEYFLFTKAYPRALVITQTLFQKLHCAKQLFDIQELYLLKFEALFYNSQVSNAKNLLSDIGWQESSSKHLAREMVSGSKWRLTSINHLFSSNKLETITQSEGGEFFDSLSGKCAKLRFKGKLVSLFYDKKVSVIVPVYNAEKTIATSLRSLIEQTWKNVEIIVVNDASTDRTNEKLQAFENQHSQMKVLTNTVNLGAYASRNLGVQASTGDFLTVMDADDWAHPQKIEKQILPLLFNSKLQATVSHWVRCSDDLHFSKVRAGRSWVHRNVSSLMIRKSVLNFLKGWDQVRVNADTEFYERLLAQFGRPSILEVLPDVPLSLGRAHNASLTQNSATHLITQFGGIRKTYMDFARVWHMHTDQYPNPSSVAERPFPVPPIMCMQEKKTANAKRFRLWQKALDEDWYTTIYDDVDKMGAGLHEHYWQTGEKEGRYPSALFNPTAYAYKFKLSKSTSPTWHALNNGWSFDEPVQLDGSCKGKLLSGQRVALFGHAVSTTIFGAERSLVDIATALSNAGVEITLFLPSLNNKHYIEELRCLVKTIIFIPLPWAKRGRDPLDSIVDYLEGHFKRGEYDCVYTNTITLVEPLIAAKQASIPSITHVRELVEYDNDLAGILNESSSETHQRVVQSADYFIANSKETAQWLSCPNRTSVVYNCVSDFGAVKRVFDTPPLKICMLSSNVKKKGVEDFFKVADALSGNSNFQFTLFGPITHEVLTAQKRYGEAAVRVAGYIDSPKTAIESHHVVLSLSSFKESFGRTVAEAMAVGRVVVGYRWGAVAELLDSDSGYLVEYKDIKSIVSTLKFLMEHQRELLRVGDAARKRARAMFSSDVFQVNLINSLSSMLKAEEYLE